jgi:erythronate-4-phosphate dehydrogenase
VLGVIGVGHVGTKVVHSAEMLGMRVYLCDPPRVRNDGVCGFISLDGILRECDLLTFHVPLNIDGPDRTMGLINSDMLNRMNPGTIIINTSRGEIADGNALISALDDGRIAGVVLDVWENEPDIDLKLLKRCIIGTPHIAGYSADGKARGTAMIVQAFSRFFDLGIEDWEPEAIPPPPESSIQIDCSGLSHEEILLRAVEFTYKVETDHQRLMESPQSFEKLRGDYPLRREFKAYTINPENGDAEISRICTRMGFNGS